MISIKSSLTSVLVMTLLSVSPVAQAQKLPAPLVDAARKAVTSNPEVQARWHAFLAAEEERGVASGAWRPRIDLDMSIGREHKETPAGAGGNFGTFNFNSTRLSLDQMLFDGGFTGSEVERLGHAKLTRYYELLDASEQAAQAALQAYADVLTAQERVAGAKDNYVVHKQTAMQVDERYKAGVSKGADSEQANGRLALSESTLLDELTKLNDATARYLTVIGELPSKAMRALPDPFQLGKMPASGLQALSEGLPRNPALLAAVQNARANAAAIKTRQSAFMPRINLQAYATVTNNEGGYRGDGRSEGAQLVLNYNLYRGGSDQARERQAVAQKDQALDLQEKACRDARQTLSIAYNDVNSLVEQLKYLDQHRITTDKAREAYRNQFEIGQRTLLDLLDTQNEFFAANQAYVSARYKQFAAQARTLASSGQLLSALGVARADLPNEKDAGQTQAALTAKDTCPPTPPVVLTVDKTVAKLPSLPGSYVVLLPSPDGTVGQVRVTSQGGERTLQRSQDAALLDGTAGAYQPDPNTLQQDFGAAVAARPPLPEQFRLFFNSGSTNMTKQSSADLPKVLDALKKRKVPDVSVVGHTDTVGTEARNQALGLKRANAVAGKIRAEGLDKVDVSVESQGESRLLVPTKDNVPEAMNRRVEITVR
jgi:adhesin transport system outer membrane protein